MITMFIDLWCLPRAALGVSAYANFFVNEEMGSLRLDPPDDGVLLRAALNPGGSCE
jgi:hypothetical protein